MCSCPEYATLMNYWLKSNGVRSARFLSHFLRHTHILCCVVHPYGNSWRPWAHRLAGPTSYCYHIPSPGRREQQIAFGKRVDFVGVGCSFRALRVFDSLHFFSPTSSLPTTTTLLPIVIQLASTSGLPLRCLVWALSLGVCLGANATLIGAPVNVVGVSLLEQAGHTVTFGEFVKMGTPVALISLVVCTIYVLIKAASGWY